MDRYERLQRRLKIARAEAADAERVWLTALDHTPPTDDEAAAAQAARRLHAVWQERERATSRVAELEQHIAGRTPRARRLRHGASFAVWHVRGRLARAPARE